MTATFSSSKLGQSKVSELNERVTKLALPNLFSEIKGLQQSNHLSKSLANKLQRTQQSIRGNEADLFSQFPFHGNLLTALCLHFDLFDNSGEDEVEVSDLCSETLERFPGNISAYLNQFYLSLADENLETAEEIVSFLERKYVSHEKPFDTELQTLIAKADLAYLYHQLDPKLYYHSVNHFEACLRGAKAIFLKWKALLDNSESGDILKRTVSAWQYYLLTTYSRMLNSDFLYIQEDAGERVRTRESCFQRICDLGEEILQTTSNQGVHQTILSRTLIDMYDAHFKMKFPITDQKCHCQMCIMLVETFSKGAELFRDIPQNNEYGSVVSLLSLALDLKPDDGHILEKIGRLKRTTACSESDLHEAKDLLQRCVDKYPTRHVAWHQLAKTYRMLWLYPQQQEFFTNPIRTGHKTKKKQRKKPKDDLFSYMASQIASMQESGQSEESSRPETSTETSPASMEKQVLPVENTDEHEEMNAFLPTPVVIQSKHLAKKGVPKHYKKRDWFDSFRTENPLTTGDEPFYLKKALECFKRANHLVNGTSCQLWVDQSRIHISLKQFKKAEGCFAKAKKCTSSTLHDKAYLYEQWGMYAQCHQKQTEKAKTCYRHAVEFSVQSFEKSKLAFYNLMDILQDQLKNIEDKSERTTQHEPGRINSKQQLEKEYALLHKLVENFKDAKLMLCEIMSKANWRGHKDVRDLAWELVDIFASTECYEDAWCYISSNLIHTAEKGHHPLILKVAFGLARKLQIIEYGLASCETGDDNCNENRNVLSVLFDHFSHPPLKRTSSEGSTQTKDCFESMSFPLSRCLSECFTYPAQASDVLLVSDGSVEEPKDCALVNSVLSQCGLSVLGADDILPGFIEPQIFLEFMQYTNMVLIFTDDIMSEDRRNLLRLANTIIHEFPQGGSNKHVVCLHSKANQVCDLHRFVKVIDIKGMLNPKSEEIASEKYLFVRKLFDILSG